MPHDRIAAILDGWPNAIKDVPLLSLREADCITAIQRVADLIVTCPAEEMYKYYEDGALFVRFVLPDSFIYEDDFYEHVRT